MPSLCSLCGVNGPMLNFRLQLDPAFIIKIQLIRASEQRHERRSFSNLQINQIEPDFEGQSPILYILRHRFLHLTISTKRGRVMIFRLSNHGSPPHGAALLLASRLTRRNARGISFLHYRWKSRKGAASAILLTSSNRPVPCPNRLHAIRLKLGNFALTTSPVKGSRQSMWRATCSARIMSAPTGCHLHVPGPAIIGVTRKPARRSRARSSPGGSRAAERCAMGAGMRAKRSADQVARCRSAGGILL